MPYRVSRNGQDYGPYSMEELQSYVTSGHVLLTDMAAEEGTAQWVPVSTLVSLAPPASADGFVPAYGAIPVFAQPAEPPPNLHWGLLLLLIVITGGFFVPVWYGILASWTRKIAPRSAVPMLYIVCCGLIVLQLVLLIGAGTKAPSYSLTTLVAAVLQLVTRFKMRSLLLEHYNTVEPIGLRLSGVMTFFFGELYFQYHFNQINRLTGLR